MKIDFIASAKEITEERVKGKTVVVIDVLRATSVMTTALANGAQQIIPVLSPEEAFNIQHKMGKEKVILGGERDAIPIQGFDYGNSPFSYTPDVIKNKTLVITTTNGTRAILHSKTAKRLLIASFLNDQAIIGAIKDDADIVFVASGSNDLFTLEDSLCAGKLAFELAQSHQADLSDAAVAMCSLYEQHQTNLIAIASKGKHYQRLEKLGNIDDLEFCFKSDVYDVIPHYNKEGVIVIEK
ncbi:2-phosphosulfolactate phosphatase [Labilibacter marinus]|uniref:2-phosphosulfolactate phosphatase n=1 Tax=Labilibacter marinus TaxID=1477105 RepID=UPI00083150E6|nr:2-phosphosulfolactate phosphatase [Labilibacter marinus]